MKPLEQIVAENGGDDTPGLDTHNLTGRMVERVYPLGQEPGEHDGYTVGVDRHYDEPDLNIRHDDDGLPCRACAGIYEDEGTYAPLATFDELLDCE